jgi:hypothetical protein
LPILSLVLAAKEHPAPEQAPSVQFMRLIVKYKMTIRYTIASGVRSEKMANNVIKQMKTNRLMA